MNVKIISIIICKIIFIIFIQGLLGLQAAYAATYYVSPSGNDANTGTTLSAPVKTITKAVSKALVSGDIIYVLTGTYVESFSIRKNGITLSSYPGNSPVIDGGTTLPVNNWEDLITVYGSNNTISGFELKNSNVNGRVQGCRAIRLEGNYNRVSNVKAHHTWDAGIVVFGDNNIVEDSIIYQAALWNSIAQGANGINWAGALSARGVVNLILRRNIIYNNWGEGIILMDADHPIVEDNVSYDNWTYNLYFDNTQYGIMQRNLVYTSSSPAIPLRSAGQGILLTDEYSSPSIPSSYNTVINNLVYNTDINAFDWTKVANTGLNNVLIANNTIVDGNLRTGVGGSLNIVNKNSQIRNNIILGRNSFVPSNTGITFSHNNWAVIPPKAASASNIVGDPQIARTGTTTPGTLTSDYFKVLGSSQVRDTAMPLNSVTNDFFKVTRGAAPDIGGYEFQIPGTDSTAPSAPSGLSANVNSSQVNLAWNASTDNVGVAGYKIYRNSTEIGTSTVASFTDTSGTGGTTYNYTVKASDIAGNLSAFSNTATVTLAPQAQLSITSYFTGNITTISAKTTWTTNILSSGHVSYGTSASNFTKWSFFNELSTNHTVNITGLVPNTTYYYIITARDSGGKYAPSPIASFRTSL
jgi:chitodextrinase